MCVKDDVLPAVTNRWESAPQIHSRIGLWSLVSVRNALRDLAKDGRIERKLKPHPHGNRFGLLLFKTRVMEPAE